MDNLSGTPIPTTSKTPEWHPRESRISRLHIYNAFVEESRRLYHKGRPTLLSPKERIKLLSRLLCNILNPLNAKQQKDAEVATGLFAQKCEVRYKTTSMGKQRFYDKYKDWLSKSFLDDLPDSIKANITGSPVVFPRAEYNSLSEHQYMQRKRTQEIISKEPSELIELASMTVMHGKDESQKNNKDDLMSDQLSSDTEIKLSCRHICIGSYSYKPRNKVRISSEGVTILAPSLRRLASDDIILHIPLKSVVQVQAHADERPAILLYTEAKTGEYVRRALDMHRESGPYFEPSSTIDEQKRITLVPRQLSRRAVTALRSLFGMVLDELDALEARRKLGMLGSSPSEHEHSATSDIERDPSPAAERDDAPAKDNGSPANMRDNASSSSSIIFPPSPTPISVSSPHSSSSSVESPKSSHSSKKRKNRHKKNKSNKKMKYVLVKNPEPHAVDAFLAGVAPILKSLSPVLLNMAKTEIISAALKYERKMLTDSCNGIGGKI